MAKGKPSRWHSFLNNVEARCLGWAGAVAAYTLESKHPRAVDTEDSAECLGHWEQTVFCMAQLLWPTGNLDIEYSILVGAKGSTHARPVTSYARLVWKKKLDAPHNAYITLQLSQLHISKRDYVDQRFYANRICTLRILENQLIVRLKKKFGTNYGAAMIGEWNKMEHIEKAPPAY